MARQPVAQTQQAEVLRGQDMDLDPVQYEIFRHRLFNILEEGRIAIRKVSGSPVVVEGGECMCAFYAADGTPILVAAGVLLHCLGAKDFIKKTIEWYEDSPGINDGDQFFWNDPYIGGAHLPDMIIIRPIFHRGKRIGWTGSIMHTADTGGLEPSGMMSTATEIFHEGIRILGLKVMDGGKFRPDNFRTIVDQCRDPHLVGLDTKAKIAANNVCAKSYLDLVEKYGIEFVEKASQKIIEDSEKMARARLSALPDGTWRSKIYCHSREKGVDEPFKVVCTMTKEDDNITFDFTGTSRQRELSYNCTLPGTWSGLMPALAGMLLYDVPWNGGMFEPVTLIAPEGSLVNCRFPAAVSNSAVAGAVMVSTTAHACVARMLYAGGLHEDVNACWRGFATAPFGLFGGRNQFGGPVIGAILDGFGRGLGAAPNRDGVDSGGNEQNPQSSISDIEITEMNYPFMYLTRNHATDSAGFGKYSGGIGPQRILMAHGSDYLTVGHRGYGHRTPGGWGLFGGYPPGVEDGVAVLNSNLEERLKQSWYPTSMDELSHLKDDLFYPTAPIREMRINDYDIVANQIGAGSGYGDPLDRDPLKVEEDVKKGAVSTHNAALIYGVIVKEGSLDLDLVATEKRRQELREERLAQGKRMK